MVTEAGRSKKISPKMTDRQGYATRVGKILRSRVGKSGLQKNNDSTKMKGNEN